MRRCHLIFEGCREQKQENVLALVVHTITTVLKLPINSDSEIDKAHRYGRSIAGRPRPIIVKFVKHSTRDLVLMAAKELKHSDDNIYINEDLPSSLTNRRAELRSVLLHARSLETDAKQKDDRIFIAGKQYDHGSLDSLPKELSLEVARTKKVAPNAIAFYSRFSPLSNFYSCSFVLNNATYSSNEQAFQAQRALNIGRDDIVKKIMQEDDCYAIKKIGDSLKILPGSDWYTSRDSTMKNILLDKFRQHDVMLGKLQATGTCVLIEGTRDSYWGSDVNLNDSKLKTNVWSGQNKLDTLLSQVRDQLNLK